MSVIKAELIKMKHSPWWILYIILPLMPAVMGVSNYLNNIQILKGGWYSLWTQETLFYANFFFAPLVGLCCAWQWRMEHKGKNWNLMLSVPQHRSALFGAKLCIAMFIAAATQVWVGVLFFVTGKMIGLSGMMPKEIAWWLIRGTFAGLVIAALQSWLSMEIRSFSIPIVIALLGSIAGFLLSNKGLGVYWPYSLILEGMNSNKYEDVLAGGQTAFYISGLVYFSLFFIAAAHRMKKCAP